MLYIGVTLLGWRECEVWRMTPYKLMTLFKVHKKFNPDRFKQDAEAPEGADDVKSILTGGL